MALVKVKPTSAGRRALVKVVNAGLHKGAPVASLVEPQKRGSGRNNNGHITVRHKGGGHKHHYRVVDFKRNKDGIPARVERLEYDPNRSANLALLLYADGERRYVIAARGVAVGTQLLSGSEAGVKPGNCLPLRNIPVVVVSIVAGENRGRILGVVEVLQKPVNRADLLAVQARLRGQTFWHTSHP